MKILFTELARSELIDAVAYYEMEVPRLGEAREMLHFKNCG